MGRRRADRGPLISTLGPVSARTFAVFMGVLAIIGLLAYGVISKGHGTLAEGETVPTTALPKLDGSGTGSLADYGGKFGLPWFWRGCSWRQTVRVRPWALRASARCASFRSRSFLSSGNGKFGWFSEKVRMAPLGRFSPRNCPWPNANPPGCPRRKTCCAGALSNR